MSTKQFWIKVALLVTSALGLFAQVNADVIDDLYQTRVQVNNQSQSEQNRAFRESLYQVLIKVSGDTAITDQSRVRQQAQRARDFIRSYQYEITDNLYLVADFDESKINALVTNTGFPIWGKRRPSVLVWLAIKENNERQLLSAGNSSEVKVLLDRYASSRGIKLTYPLMDIEDIGMVNVFDVWGRFDDSVREASFRYVPEATLSARLYKTENTQTDAQTQWQLDWQILDSDIPQQGLLFAPTQEQVIQEFSNMIADHLAERYAVDLSQLTADNGDVPLYIMNLDSIESYASVVDFFRSLTIVSDIKLTRLSGETGEFSLSLVGTPDDLIATLALDNHISRKTDAFGRVGENLEYFWNP